MDPDPERVELCPDARVVPRRSPVGANPGIPDDSWKRGGRIRFQSLQENRSPVEAEVEALPVNVSDIIHRVLVHISISSILN